MSSPEAHHRRLLCSAFLLLLSLILVACTAESSHNGSQTMTRSVITIDPASSGERQSMENMVDERFELLSLVFRLAGRSEYRDRGTDYQNKVATTFAKFGNHAAVRYATNLPLGYDAVFNFAVHIIEEEGRFVFLEDIESLVEDGRWNRRSAPEFLALLNDFYLQTHFAVFYEENIPFYREETRRFIEQTYGEIDLEWFGAYVDPANLRCVYSPSSSRHNYGAVVNERIVYAAVSSEGSAIVHEYCHSFANPLAHIWYAENEAFRGWCDASVDTSINSQYSSGKTIAGEYLTRAYTILYSVEHGQALQPLLQTEKKSGFPYIEEVYSVIASYEKTETEISESAFYSGGYMQWNAAKESATVNAADLGDLQMTRLDPPRGMLPLGMIDKRHGYLIDKDSPETLWLYDYQEQVFNEIVDCRNTGRTLATEIAFGGRWLIWMEIEAYRQLASGSKVREVYLMARDLLTTDESAADMLLATGSNTPAEGFYLPFSSLCLSGDNLVYRYSSFSGGQRDTEVRLHNLAEGVTQTLDRREFANREQILRCSIAEKFVVWDVQHRYRSYPDDLPDQEAATYSLMLYELDKGDSVAYRPEMLSGRSFLHTPIAHQDSIFALYQYPPRINWVNVSSYKPAPPFEPGEIYQVKTQGFKTCIVRILPTFSTATMFVREYDYSTGLLQEFTKKDAPLAIEYGDTYIGKRLLSWQSNIGDALFVFDLRTENIIELPHEFAVVEEASADLCVAAVPGLDADYLYFALMTGDEAAYLLRVE